MAKLKESRTTYSAEPITTVTTRGHTEIPRALRERYRVTAKTRLRWVDTGEGLLVIPLEQPIVPRHGRRRKTTATRESRKTLNPQNQEFLRWLDEWMKEPDDWTPEQWDEFERELRANRLRFRDIEL